MSTQIISVLTKKEDIRKIIDKIKVYSFEELERHPHFEFSILEKLTDLNKIKETFSKFELIKSIEIRENDKKQRHYSLNYELTDGTYVVIAFLLEDKPIIINGFHVSRNYRNFEKSLRKNYSEKLI